MRRSLWPSLWLALLCLCGLPLVGCDDEVAALADGGFVDSAISLPDPDAAPRPDASRVGRLLLEVDMPSDRLREGAAPMVVGLILSGSMDGNLTGEIVVEGALADVSRLEFGPNQRRVEVSIWAPFDADQDDGEARIVITVPGTSKVTLVLPIIDVHHTIELSFDPEQLAFVRASNDKSRRLISPTVIDGESGPQAESNLRGKGTLRCPRRSFTTRFEEPVRIGDSPPLKHVLFISMCMATTYLKMPVAYGVLQSEGLFPPWFNLAELRYGGESRGIYLVVERPRKAVPRVFPQNQLLIRHLSDSNYEIKRPSADKVEDPEALVAPYLRIYQLRRELEGQALLDAFDEAMDYDLYLRWLAVNSVVENGDYIDEVFFYDGAPRRGPGEGLYLSPMAWDYDDIFKNCHVPRPLAEPLFYCAESGLDRATRDTPPARARYVDVLRGVMARALAPAAFAARVERVRDEMAIYMARPGVSEVMTREAGAPDVVAGALELKRRHAARHLQLSDLLEAE